MTRKHFFAAVPPRLFGLAARLAAQRALVFLSIAVTALCLATPAIAQVNVSVTVLPAAVDEDDVPNLVFTFTRDGDLTSPLAVNFLVGGTAAFGPDYGQSGADTFDASSGTVTFLAASPIAVVTIDPVPDTLFETDETVVLTVIAGTGYDPAAPTSDTGTITNDDPMPSISIDSVTVNEADGTADFTVTQSAESGVTTTFEYSTTDGTATAGMDYTGATDEPGAIPAGDTMTTVSILITSDTFYEGGPEDFTVTLSNPDNATIAPGSETGTGTINDDDDPPSFSVNDVTLPEGNAGPTAFTFKITKTGDTVFSAFVDYETVDGTATAPSDYTAIPPTTVEFASNEYEKEITVTVNGDPTPEPDETFTVELSTPQSASIADGVGLGTITNDDGAPPIVYVDDDWTAVPNGTDPDGAGPATSMGFDAFATMAW